MEFVGLVKEKVEHILGHKQNSLLQCTAVVRQSGDHGQEVQTHMHACMCVCTHTGSI